MFLKLFKYINVEFYLQHANGICFSGDRHWETSLSKKKAK